MYWKIEEAKEELRIRQENLKLVKRVDEFLGDCSVPVNIQGLLCRHVATARIEEILFEERCREGGLKPTFITYSKDIFVTNNPSKLRIVRLIIFNGNGKKGGYRLQRIDLANMERINKIPFYLIKTKWDESLVQFHHRARKEAGLNGEIIDLSNWLQAIGPARKYYRYLLAVCLTRGILFESFESPGFPDLETFTKTVVLPAWEAVQVEFGCSPLIVKHPDTPDPTEEERILNWYPSSVLRAIPRDYL